MAAPVRLLREASQHSPEDPLEVTLLELVTAVGEVTEDEREVVATVVHLLRTRRVRLCGSFRGAILSLS